MDLDRELGERGLSEAMDRLRERLENGGWHQGPFTEALLWITALKDLHTSGIDYSSTDGEMLKALGWARNYAAHSLLTLSAVNLASSGLTGAGLTGMRMTGGGGHLVWVDEAVLPLRPDEYGRRGLYQGLVAGRGVLVPLETAQTYLMNLK